LAEAKKAETPPEIADSGATGTQTTPTSSEEATAIARFATKGGQGLRSVTPELLEELARSGEPADVKEKVVVSYLLAHQQAVEADLRVRLDTKRKESRVLRRKVGELQEDIGTLKGDKRVLKQRLKSATSDRAKRTFQAAVGSVAFGFSGGFFGAQSWLVGGLLFAIGTALFISTWFFGVKTGDETV